MAGRGVAGENVDFGRDVFPILRRACFECHGPKAQEADLRLDDRASTLEHYSAIVPGDAENSELYRRTVLPAGDEAIMPAVGKPLSRAETETLRKWIDSGAEWPEDFAPPQHWAYVAPVRPEVPGDLVQRGWVRNAVDGFVLARLEAEGLAPAPEAERATLLRRVYLDLVGLPPSPEEVDAFLADDRDDAYEAVVDRLLASPQFGERWARPWLDLARYADSHGFQRDDLRQLWAYRDWVIRALNADMPFTQFTIEQLAGDLLPNATESQMIATGFNRCTMTNVEAGADPEETRTNQVIDRVNTTATVWLGSTLECAQCHDHKYDPFTQREYYQLFAFFNNTAIEADRAKPDVPASIKFLGPRMKLAGAEADERAPLERKLKTLDEQIAARAAELRKGMRTWEAEQRASLAETPRSQALKLEDFASAEGAAHRKLEDESVLLVDDPPDIDVYTFTATTDARRITAFKLEALTDDSLPGGGPGRGDARRPNFVLSTFTVEAAPRGSREFKPVRLVRATADYAQPNFGAAAAIDDDPQTGWGIFPRFFMPHWAQFEPAGPLDFEGGVTLQFRLVQQFGGRRTIGRLRVSAVTGNLNLTPVPAEVARALALPAKSRTRAQRRAVQRFRQEQNEPMRRLRAERSELVLKLKNINEPTTLVMRELAEPRPTMVFARGDFRQPADAVEPAAPAVLHPYRSAEGDRLALAQWLVDRRNPLVARVTVNRWWAELFGHGIVTTVEDFGVKGEPPTHPELLDWLAVEFMDSGWSMKSVLRTIVTSATYRQSSNVSPQLLARDDPNKLYARGPRIRMDAEMIRDNALAVSGLLSKKQFGPPIRPYQPEGLWTKVGGERVDYVTSPGSEQHRRGIYVVLKRSTPYPSFVNFDASGRLACTAKRSRSNTPLQALTLLNDPVYVEAARALARRTVREQGADDVGAGIRRMFRLCLCREPLASERSALERLYAAQLEDAQRDPRATAALVGKAKLPRGTTPAEMAAWHSVATTLMNLDEAITKE